MRIRQAFLLVAIPVLVVGALAGPSFAGSQAEKIEGQEDHGDERGVRQQQGDPERLHL